MKYLIINADDFNLTSGVDRAILDCHDRGVVSSTTILMTFPIKKNKIKHLLNRPFLGKGIHLSITLGEPRSSSFKSSFSKMSPQKIKSIPEVKLMKEFEAQILQFQDSFGVLPTHIDTHHHLHIYSNLFNVILKLSYKYKIPHRLVPLNTSEVRRSLLKDKIPIPHYFFGDLDHKKHWTLTSLCRQISSLPKGVSEIMVHPGFVTKELTKISSFNQAREVERKALIHDRLKNLVKQENIELIHFGEMTYFTDLF